MKDNVYQLTADDLSQAFEAYEDAEVLEIEETACDVKKCPIKGFTSSPSRIDVILASNKYIKKEFATFKLHVCTTFPKTENYKALVIQYFCRIEVDTTKVSLVNLFDCINEVNQLFAVKVVLREVYDNGYLFCVEGRFHVTNADDIVKWFDKNMWGLYDASVHVLVKVGSNYRFNYLHALQNNLPKSNQKYDNIRVIDLD